MSYGEFVGKASGNVKPENDMPKYSKDLKIPEIFIN